MESPDYRSWMPEWMMHAARAATALSAGGLMLSTLADKSGHRQGLRTAFAASTLGWGTTLLLFTRWHDAFDYKGRRQLEQQIVDGVSSYVMLPEGGVGLDVGCGSGALAIACAKRNPHARMVGVDTWAPGYSYSQELCERNALAEGVDDRCSFMEGDARRLPFPDETFDAVTSNYCYHNIALANKQDLVLETLRVLKKGGCFAIHDLMSPARYGDLSELLDRIAQSGCQDIEVIDTTCGMFMTPQEASGLFLGGSTLLVGIK